MKTQHITAALRNAATPAARLAAWQSYGTRRNLGRIRKEQAKTWNAGKTPAEIRARLIASEGPELSAPTCPRPLLWLDDANGADDLNFWEGRATLRREIRALIADIRALCPALTDTPAATSALRGELGRMLAQRAELMETINA